ncbi:MAG: FkbM family methyltransferase, partial [Sphaerospermopsis kisseleviana]
LWMNHNKPNSFSLVKRENIAKSLSTLTVALDDLFAWEKLNRLDYLKIDVEGAEKQVIAGATKILEKYRPIIQIEITFDDIDINLDNYSVFRASAQSPNKIYIPNENSKIQIATVLGWQKIQN